MHGLPRFTAASAVSTAQVVKPWPGSRRPTIEGRFCVDGSELNTCTDGTVCTPLYGGFSGVGNCCFPGRINCRGTCRNPCPSGTSLDPQTCLCVRDCGPCEAYGMVQDPETCVCQCDPPTNIQCNGICIDPKTDQTFCGGCPGDTCNPYNQACCNGVCTDLGTKQNCRKCGDQVPAGWDCCYWTPTELGTKQNCRTCGEQCLGGRDCTALGCKCPAGRTECGICCPPTHKGCCNLTCTNLDTNTSHCGYCGHQCPTGASCQNGQCVCPSGTRLCGGACWPNAQLCCQNSGCPANATACCPGCADLMGNQGIAWLTAWQQSQPPNTPWATCASGTFQCHPSLVIVTSQPGHGIGTLNQTCCPAGSTGLNTQGQCI